MGGKERNPVQKNMLGDQRRKTYGIYYIQVRKRLPIAKKKKKNSRADQEKGFARETEKFLSKGGLNREGRPIYFFKSAWAWGPQSSRGKSGHTLGKERPECSASPRASLPFGEKPRKDSKTPTKFTQSSERGQGRAPFHAGERHQQRMRKR